MIVGMNPYAPFCEAEHQRRDWISTSACLSVASSRVPSHGEKRREPSGQATGRPFLVRFLAAQKMNSPLGETNQESDRFLARGCAES